MLRFADGKPGRRRVHLDYGDDAKLIVLEGVDDPRCRTTCGERLATPAPRTRRARDTRGSSEGEGPGASAQRGATGCDRVRKSVRSIRANDARDASIMPTGTIAIRPQRNHWARFNLKWRRAARLLMPHYSRRSATEGSRRAVRAAGRHAATSAATASALHCASHYPRIGWIDADEHRSHHPASGEREREATRQARGHRRAVPPASPDAATGWRGAQCHTHAELAHACRHAVADDAGGCRVESTSATSAKPPTRFDATCSRQTCAIEDLVERRRLEHRRLRVSLPHRLLDRGQQRRRVCHARVPPVSSLARPGSVAGRCDERNAGLVGRRADESRCCASMTTPTIVRGGSVSFRAAKRMRCPTAPPCGNQRRASA